MTSVWLSIDGKPWSLETISTLGQSNMALLRDENFRSFEMVVEQSIAIPLVSPLLQELADDLVQHQESHHPSEVAFPLTWQGR